MIPERHDWGSRFLKWRQHQELQWRLIAPTAFLVLAELSDFISLYEHYKAIYPLGELSARRLAGRRHALGSEDLDIMASTTRPGRDLHF